MTGVQTCALPICFPVTIIRNGKEEDEESKYEFWPICVLFSSEQVITPESKAKAKEEPKQAQEAEEESEVLTLDGVL